MITNRRTFAMLAAAAAFAGLAQAQGMPVVDAVVGNNFGHLPMFVGVEKGLFKKHGVDVTAHEPTIASDPQLIRNFVAGLAAASQYTRQHRDEAVRIFAKSVPGLDPAVGRRAVQHISYDPRISAQVMQAFEAAEDDVLRNTLQGAARLDVPAQFARAFLADAEKNYPQYFSDLAPLPER